MVKRLFFSNTARNGLERGVDRVADAVKVTLGPVGHCVGIGSRSGPPLITRDGVTIAREIEVANALENIGAKILKEAALETSEKAGDGTTTATLLAQAVVKAGSLCLAAGANPVELKRGIELAVRRVVEALNQMSLQVEMPQSIDEVIQQHNEAAPPPTLGDVAARLGLSNDLPPEIRDHPIDAANTIPGNYWIAGMRAGLAAGELDRLAREASEVKAERLAQALALWEKRRESLASIASVAMNVDRVGGELFAEAYEKVGKDGVILVEEGDGYRTSLEVTEGMKFDQGYLSAYFVNDPEHLAVSIRDAFILVYAGKISSAQELVPILERLVQTGRRELLVIAEDVDGEALATLVLNKLRGTLNVAAVKAPGFGDHRTAMLQDISLLTGAALISKETGRSLEKIEVADLGQAEKVFVTRQDTTLAGGRGDRALIRGRIAQLRSEIEKSSSEYEREKLRERLAKLSSGVAIIRVGAVTNTELKEKKARIIDALHSTQSALAEGFVPGGYVAYIRAIDALDEIQTGSPDQMLGVSIIRRALEEPLRQISENAGYSGSSVVNRVKAGQGDLGFNVRTGEYAPMIDQGIIDATRVVRLALENAASVAGLLLTTEAVITE